MSLYISICDYGPVERKRLGPFSGIELIPGSGLVQVQKPGEEDWDIVNLAGEEAHMVFIEEEPS